MRGVGRGTPSLTGRWPETAASALRKAPLQISFSRADVHGPIHAADIDARSSAPELALDVAAHELTLHLQREIHSDATVDRANAHVRVGRRRQPEADRAIHRL